MSTSWRRTVSRFVPYERRARQANDLVSNRPKPLKEVAARRNQTALNLVDQQLGTGPEMTSLSARACRPRSSPE